MQSRDRSFLTFDQVLDADVKAVNDMGAVGDGHDSGSVEAVYEYGNVWLVDQDRQGHVRSARLIEGRQIPRAGWQHERGCQCRYCYRSTGRAPASGPERHHAAGSSHFPSIETAT